MIPVNYLSIHKKYRCQSLMFQHWWLQESHIWFQSYLQAPALLQVEYRPCSRESIASKNRLKPKLLSLNVVFDSNFQRSQSLKNNLLNFVTILIEELYSSYLLWITWFVEKDVASFRRLLNICCETIKILNCRRINLVNDIIIEY